MATVAGSGCSELLNSLRRTSPRDVGSDNRSARPRTISTQRRRARTEFGCRGPGFRAHFEQVGAGVVQQIGSRSKWWSGPGHRCVGPGDDNPEPAARKRRRGPLFTRPSTSIARQAIPLGQAGSRGFPATEWTGEPDDIGRRRNWVPRGAHPAPTVCVVGTCGATFRAMAGDVLPVQSRTQDPDSRQTIESAAREIWPGRGFRVLEPSRQPNPSVDRSRPFSNTRWPSLRGTITQSDSGQQLGHFS